MVALMKRRYLQFISHFFALTGITVLLAAGAIYGERIYWLFAVFFTTLSVLSYGYAILCLLALRIEVSVTPIAVTRGEEAVFTIRMTKRFPLFVPRITLYVKLTDDQKKPFIYKTACTDAQPAEIRIPMQYETKGVYNARLCSYAVGDLFGIATLLPFYKKNFYLGQLFVMPKIIRNTYDLSAGDRQSAQDTISMQANTVFAGDVREYMYGDPLKSVHWKLSARVNKLFVKKYEDEAHPLLDLILCTKADGDIYYDQYVCELALSIAAYCIENSISLCFFAGPHSFGRVENKLQLQKLALEMSKKQMTALCNGSCGGSVTRNSNKLYITDEQGMETLEYSRHDLYFYIMQPADGQPDSAEATEKNIFVLPYKNQLEQALKGEKNERNL